MKQQRQRIKNNRSVLVSCGLLVLVAVLCGGCSDSGKTPAKAVPVAAKAVRQPVTQPTATVAIVMPQPAYTYNPSGRRDPFAPIIQREEKQQLTANRPPLERFGLFEFKLTGIVWGGFGYHAIVEGPDRKGYFVRTGDVIGMNGGVIKRITQGAVVVEERYHDAAGKVVRKEITIEVQKKQEGMQ